MEISKKIADVLGTSPLHTLVPDRQFNDCRYCIDSSEMKKLGWTENPDFDGDLVKTIEWYTTNRAWYRT
jgi:dTDP-glucose 4,6-dehydratase